MKATYRVYGMFDGHETHRQKLSFEPSRDYDWSENGVTRKVGVKNSDVTGTNDYTEVVVECADPDAEIAGQIDDGIFENVRTGRIEKLIDGEWVEYDPRDGYHSTVRALKERHGSFSLDDHDFYLDGGEYVLTHDAELVNYRDGIAFEAIAVRTDDDADPDGVVNGYEVIWYIPDGIPEEAEYPGDYVDWDRPDDVELKCGYLYQEDRTI